MMKRHPRSRPRQTFYDQRGCELFEQICELDEYYLTRTEISSMHRHAAEIAACLGPRIVLIEYGSGSGGLVIGLDLQKDAAVLEAAYNDRQGVTARFNLNLLDRINKELAADFQLERFRHHAFYNETASRIEMHLVSLARQTVHIADREFTLHTDETICTEYSDKYDLTAFHGVARPSGLQFQQVWTDEH